MEDTWWMSKYGVQDVKYTVDLPKLSTINRIRIDFKYPPEDFKLIIHKDKEIHDIHAKIVGLDKEFYDITFAHLNMIGFTLEFTKLNTKYSFSN